jgi:general secretion pathway protein D
MIKKALLFSLCLIPFLVVYSAENESPESITITSEHDNQSLQPDQLVELNFNNASLQNIADQIAQIFNVTFLCDDVVKIPSTTIEALKESKVSFTSNIPFTKKRAWDMFTTFLELAGWSIVPTTDPQIFRITMIDKANKSPLPTFINTPIDMLPDNDQRIRYVCILENSPSDQMKTLVDKLKSPKALTDVFAILNALIITDTAYNIQSLLTIIRELDSTTKTQALSVLHLKEADASEVVELIKTLQQTDSSPQAPWMPPKQESTLFYFSKDVTLISAPRTNSVILVGPQDGVKRIETFILEHVDTELKQRYNPVHVYNLDFAPAEQIADILNNAVKFGKTSDSASKRVGEAGGVVGGLKYFGDIHIEPVKEGNRLIVRSSQEDFDHLKDIIQQLDQKQPQVAIEVTIAIVSLDKKRQWGVQWNTKKPRTVDAQLTGFFGSKAKIDDKTPSLIGDLLSLAGAAKQGTTIFTLGKKSVYAILGMFSSYGQTRVIANPFIVTTNKYRGTVSISEERRVVSEFIEGDRTTKGFGTYTAETTVHVTPQINSQGTINLNIQVILQDFTSPQSAAGDSQAEDANKICREVKTSANVSNGETLVLGGLISKKKEYSKTKFPILSQIPIIGALFRNEDLEVEDNLLVIFMSPTIIQPTGEEILRYTKNKADYIHSISKSWHKQELLDRDPIHRWFFKPIDEEIEDDIPAFVNKGVRHMEKMKKLQMQLPANHNSVIHSVAHNKEEK